MCLTSMSFSTQASWRLNSNMLAWSSAKPLRVNAYLNSKSVPNSASNLLAGFLIRSAPSTIEICLSSLDLLTKLLESWMCKLKLQCKPTCFLRTLLLQHQPDDHLAPGFHEWPIQQACPADGVDDLRSQVAQDVHTLILRPINRLFQVCSWHNIRAATSSR